MHHSTRSISVRLALAAALLLGGIVLAQPRIVVSIHPLFDLTQRIAGPDVEVTRLLPPGASPHGFDPTPSVIAAVERADVLILIGGIDEWAHDLASTGANGPEVFELLPLFGDLSSLLPEDHDADEHAAEEHAEDEHAEGDHAGDEHAEDGHAGENGHHHGGVNPHIWLDPVLMQTAANAIGERLAQLDPERADTYRANAADLVAQLRGLDGELELILAPVRGAPFVPFHDAWPYFAARYGLDLVLEIEPFPGREPSPRYLADVVEAIRSTGAAAVFSESQLADRPAQVLAQEAGVVVRVLDPIGGTTGRASYEELLRHNARVIAEALAGSGDAP